MKEDSTLAGTKNDEQLTPKIRLLLEVARRASWDALHGPRHLRAGRFRPISSAHLGADQQGVPADAPPPRR